MRFASRIKRIKKYLRRLRPYARKRKDRFGNLILPCKTRILKSKIVFEGPSSFNNTIETGNESRIQESTIQIRGRNNRISIGEGCIIEKGCRIEIVGSGCSIVLGNGVWLRGVYISLYPDDNHLVIGENSFISYGTEIGISEQTTVYIGSRLMCSSNVRIRSSDGHAILQAGKRINIGKDVWIGNHVWICPNVEIFKGSRVSDDSVIASGSLVNRPFDEPNVLLAGRPCSVKKRNITWER